MSHSHVLPALPFTAVRPNGSVLARFAADASDALPAALAPGLHKCARF